MEEFLQGLLEASLSGSVVILVVLLLRQLMKKAPRQMICLLWLLAGLRLVMPFALESPVSLQPQMELASVEQTLQWTHQSHQSPEQISGGQPAAKAVALEAVLAPIWCLGVGALVLSSLLSYARLRAKVRGSVQAGDGCWESEKIETAFVLGFFPADIYLPRHLSGEVRQCIVAHEQAHIARRDHWMKLLGYGVLSLHWFNPLVWLAYSLLCRDIEMACDEQVIRSMDMSQRKVYSNVLLASAVGHRTLTAYPVAFGEVSVKKRILSVLNYQKPQGRMVLTAMSMLVFVAVCFLTDPVRVPQGAMSLEQHPVGQQLDTRDDGQVQMENSSSGAPGSIHSEYAEEDWVSLGQPFGNGGKASQWQTQESNRQTSQKTEAAAETVQVLQPEYSAPTVFTPPPAAGSNPPEDEWEPIMGGDSTKLYDGK